MKRRIISGSIEAEKYRFFGKLGVKFFKTPNDWPVSVAYEIIYDNARDLPWGLHKNTAEFLYVLDGEAEIHLSKKRSGIKAGDYLVIPPGVKHRFVTGAAPLVALSVFSPAMGWNNLDAVMCAGNARNRRKAAAGARAVGKAG